MDTHERAAGGPQPLRPASAPTVRLERPAPSGTRQDSADRPPQDSADRPLQDSADGPLQQEPADRPPRPAHPDDSSTVGFPRPEPAVRQRTIRFGRPTPVRVTVTARTKPRRRFRTWPWIVAVAVALLVVGAVLLVMLLRGDRVEGRLGSPDQAPTIAGSADPPVG